MKRLRFVIPALIVLTVAVAGTAFIVSADSHGDTFYGCLYAGSLSQVNTTALPTNCGRGMPVSWNEEQPITAEDVQQFIYTVEVEATLTVAATSFSHTAPCVAGAKVIGGGYRVAPISPVTAFRGINYMSESRPDYGAVEGWLVAGSRPVTSSGTAGIAQLTVYAICLGTPPAP